MSKSIKFKNNTYWDSDSISHKKRIVKNLLNNCINIEYGTSLNIPAGFDNRIDIPFYSLKTLSSNLTFSGTRVVVGKNVHTVKISYDMRVDWDASNDVVYYFMVTTSGGDQWGTHRAIYKTNSIQYGTTVSSFILDVAEGTEIALLTWNSSESSQSVNLWGNLYIKVLD